MRRPEVSGFWYRLISFDGLYYICKKILIMIQRIQSLYLVGATILLLFLFFSPLATFLVGEQVFSFGIMGFSTQSENTESIYITTWPLLVLVTLIILISIVAIFLYKRRMVQIRLCIFNFVALIGLVGLMAYFVYQVRDAFGTSAQNTPQATAVVCQYSYVDIFPLVAAILTFLAIRRIASDEALVRSTDRLR